MQKWSLCDSQTEGLEETLPNAVTATLRPSLPTATCNLVQRPQSLLDSYTHSTKTEHSPEPLVAQFVDTRPKGILIILELLQLGELLGVRSRVSTLLVPFLLGVSSEEAQECIVCDGTEEFDWRKHIGAV